MQEMLIEGMMYSALLLTRIVLAIIHMYVYYSFNVLVLQVCILL